MFTYLGPPLTGNQYLILRAAAAHRRLLLPQVGLAVLLSPVASLHGSLDAAYTPHLLPPRPLACAPRCLPQPEGCAASYCAGDGHGVLVGNGGLFRVHGMFELQKFEARTKFRLTRASHGGWGRFGQSDGAIEDPGTPPMTSVNAHCGPHPHDEARTSPCNITKGVKFLSELHFLEYSHSHTTRR